VGGFIGSNLREALAVRGHEVIGNRARLGEAVDPGLFDSVDVLVHCAHDFRAGQMETNVTGARLFFDAARECRRIFVSSHSARADAAGEYGTSKYQIEGFWEGETIVRPGLVIGSGGLFGRYLKVIREARIIPLVDGGRDRVAVIGISDLCNALVNLVESGSRGSYNLFNETTPQMREVVETVLRLDERRAVLLPVPFGMALAGVRLGERVGLRMPIRSESLVSMRINRSVVHRSDLKELLSTEMGMEEAIARAMGVQR
jgi:nucleoside-diphosphate-sugar epimerase